MIAVIIILFIIGIVCFVASLFLSGKEQKVQQDDSDKYLEQLLEERINQVEHRLGDVAEKSASTVKKQTRHELEKLSKEKLSEVNEYSDQVMDRINKNHSEVMFLYGLLSDKQKELDETVESLNKAQKELRISQRLNRNDDMKSWDTVQENKQFNEGKDVVSGTDMEAQKYDTEATGYSREASSQSSEQGSYDKRAQIVMLANEGKSELEIAKQLSMGVGEVRLVLELGKGV